MAASALLFGAQTRAVEAQDKVKLSVYVLDIDGDPLPGVRVNFENVATGNRGSRVSGEGGLCDAFYVPPGNRYEITPVSDRYFFGEAGSDGAVKTSVVITATEDRKFYFKGSDRVTVPDLARLTYADARSAAEDAGLTFVYSRTDPCSGVLNFGSIDECRSRVERVFDQHPGAGARVAAFSTVEARLGAWPAAREVPQVSFGFDRPGDSLTPQEACHRLLRAGFLTRVSNVLQRGCRGGNVMRQNPAGGTTAPYGSVVEVVLCSEGPHQVRIGDDLACSPRAPAP